jgi:membrane-bound lytic murein transglycosylase
MKRITHILLIISTLSLFACESNELQIAEKFITINASLENIIDMMKARSENMFQEITKTMQKEGNTAEGRERVKRADELIKNNRKLVAEIYRLQKDLIINIGEGIDPKIGSTKISMSIVL